MKLFAKCIEATSRAGFIHAQHRAGGIDRRAGHVRRNGGHVAGIPAVTFTGIVGHVAGIRTLAPGATLLDLLTQAAPALKALQSKELTRRVRDMTASELDDLNF